MPEIGVILNRKINEPELHFDTFLLFIFTTFLCTTLIRYSNLAIRAAFWYIFIIYFFYMFMHHSHLIVTFCLKLAKLMNRSCNLIHFYYFLSYVYELLRLNIFFYTLWPPKGPWWMPVIVRWRFQGRLGNSSSHRTEIDPCNGHPRRFPQPQLWRHGHGTQW